MPHAPHAPAPGWRLGSPGSLRLIERRGAKKRKTIDLRSIFDQISLISHDINFISTFFSWFSLIFSWYLWYLWSICIGGLNSVGCVANSLPAHRHGGTWRDSCSCPWQPLSRGGSGILVDKRQITKDGKFQSTKEWQKTALEGTVFFTTCYCYAFYFYFYFLKWVLIYWHLSRRWPQTSSLAVTSRGQHSKWGNQKIYKSNRVEPTSSAVCVQFVSRRSAALPLHTLNIQLPTDPLEEHSIPRSRHLKVVQTCSDLFTALTLPRHPKTAKVWKLWSAGWGAARPLLQPMLSKPSCILFTRKSSTTSRLGFDDETRIYLLNVQMSASCSMGQY